MIPYGRQSLDNGDVEAVVQVLRSDFLTQGPTVPAFESAVCKVVGAAEAIAVNSATSALHLACLAVGLQPRSLAWTSPITFVASANCIRYCGAEIDFVDVDEARANMSVPALEEKLRDARRRNRLPDVVIPVHFAGHPTDMPEIHRLAQEYGFRVIEDASHAIGARYGSTSVGAASHSDVVVFSFHPVKIITTAEGGMALTRDEQLARRMRLLRSHGISRDPGDMIEPDPPAWYYEQIDLGFNYRMTDVQAALGMSQLSKLDDFAQRRRLLVDRYLNGLAGLGLELPEEEPDVVSAWHLYVVRLPPGADRRSVFNALRSAGVGVNVHYIPVHLQPYYRRLGFRVGQYPVAERFYGRALTLPLFPAMSLEQQDRVIQAVRSVLLGSK